MKIGVKGSSLEPNKYYRLYISDTASFDIDQLDDGDVYIITDNNDDLNDLKDYVDMQLSTKQDTLTFDTTPTAGSTNPVTSGGIKTAIDSIDLSQYYTKTQVDNLLKNYVTGYVSGGNLYLTKVN